MTQPKQVTQSLNLLNAAPDMYAALVRIQAMQHGKQCPFAGADMVDAGIAGIIGTTLWFLNDASNTAIATATAPLLPKRCARPENR